MKLIPWSVVLSRLGSCRLWSLRPVTLTHWPLHWTLTHKSTSTTYPHSAHVITYRWLQLRLYFLTIKQF